MSNLTIYQSSAGSGKTYKLAKEYLKLAFMYPGAFKNILAITFTNKATQEMKSRVLKFLSELSNDKNPGLKSQLTEEGIKCDIKEQAKITLSNILHNYSDFSISTIDSFFNKVLRSFSKELRLQVGYDIELNHNEVLESITGMLLKDLNKDEELRKYIEDFILLKINEDKGWDIEKDIMRLGKEIFKERYWEKKFQIEEAGTSREISDSRKKIHVLLEDINNIIHDFEKTLKNIGDEAESVMHKYGLEPGDFAYSESGVIGFLINKIRFKKDYDPENSKRAYSVYEKNDGWYPKSSKKKTIIQSAVDESLYLLLKKAVEYINSDSTKYYSAKVLKNTLYTLGIFEDLISKLNEYRISNRLLMQSDVNGILRGLISTDNSPFIYEKIGSNYKNLLIDEFQDTSTFQWNNLLPLIINVLSERNTVFVAGDVKQSIYRWRSGNMKLLLSQIYDDLGGFKELIKTEFLKTNRRSCREIVEFNNRFFLKFAEKISSDINNRNYKNLILKAYSSGGIEQEYIKQGGYVNIDFFNDDSSEISAKESAEARVIEIVKEILSDGYLLSDILVLVRKNSEVRLVSELLTRAGYRIISSESLVVNNSPKVRIIVDLIKYIIDNKNILVRADALYNYLDFVLNDKTDYSEIFENSDKEFFENIPREFFKEDDLSRIKPVLNDLTVYEVCENLIRALGFNKIPDPYVIKFQNAVLEYSETDSSDLVSFINWWEENKGEFYIDSSANTNAVNIMTIHKAKGLQGKIVIVPYANWKINIDGNEDLVWVSSNEEPFNKSAAYPVKAIKNLNNTFFKEDYDYEFAQTRLDNLNLLYVTFTRAEERLYVLIPEIKNTVNAGKLLKNVIEEYEGYADNNFEAGKKEKAAKGKNDTGTETEHLKHYISSDWYKKLIIKSNQIKLKEFTDKDYSFRTSRGTIIHSVFAHIKTRDDIEFAINKIHSEGLIKESQKEIIRQQVNEILSNKDVKNWFGDDWEVKSETEILSKEGNILRPDRVIIKNKEAIVIDYKTGAEKEEYKKQVRQYADKLEQMGYSSVLKYLLYINREDAGGIKIVEVE